MSWTIYVADDLNHKIRMKDRWIEEQKSDIRRTIHTDEWPEYGHVVLFDEPDFFMFLNYNDTRSGGPRLVSYVKDE